MGRLYFLRILRTLCVQLAELRSLSDNCLRMMAFSLEIWRWRMRVNRPMTWESNLASTGRIPRRMCVAQFAVSLGRFCTLFNMARMKVSKLRMSFSRISRTSNP